MPEKTFSQKLQRLEEIVARLESPDIELEEGLRLLEEGVALHKECQKVLTQSQAKISKLLESNADEDKRSAAQPSEETVGLFEVQADGNEKDASTKSDEGLPF